MLMCLGHIAGQQMCAVKSIGSSYLLNLTISIIGKLQIYFWLHLTLEL
jgi:hypothetical protein